MGHHGEWGISFVEIVSLRDPTASGLRSRVTSLETESLICGEMRNQSILRPWKGEVALPSEGGRTKVSPRASVIGNSSGSNFQSLPTT
eukprot:3409775-Amphidinium_carterae.1